MNMIFKNVFFSLLLIIFLSLGTSLHAETGKRGDAKAVRLGKPIFQKHCSSCHGVNGEGEAAIPMAIRRDNYLTAPALNGTAHAWHHSDENLMDTIMEGSPRTKRMTAWKHLFDKKTVTNVIAYIKNWWPDDLLACQGPKHMSCM